MQVLHCLEGLEWAMKLGWYSLSTFNVAEYQYYEKVENGDLNWIIPGKFLAFSTPVGGARPGQDMSFPPDFYVSIFKKLGVTMVVRLNNKEYDADVPHALDSRRTS
jgi:cell division cycle 14